MVAAVIGGCSRTPTTDYPWDEQDYAACAPAGIPVIRSAGFIEQNVHATSAEAGFVTACTISRPCSVDTDCPLPMHASPATTTLRCLQGTVDAQGFAIDSGGTQGRCFQECAGGMLECAGTYCQDVVYGATIVPLCLGAR